jgi:nucleoside-diphosphate-sugar epimerase
MEIKIKINYTPLGPGNPMVTMADCTAAAHTLGWKPKMAIINGLIAQVAWQQGQA